MCNSHHRLQSSSIFSQKTWSCFRHTTTQQWQTHPSYNIFQNIPLYICSTETNIYTTIPHRENSTHWFVDIMPLFRNAPRVLVLLCSCLQLATTSAFQSGLPAHNVGHQNNPSWNKIPRSASTGEKIGSFRNSEIGYRRQVTRIAAATTDDDSGKGERRAALLGTLVLLTVPLSWGTYVPVGEWKCFSMQN